MKRKFSALSVFVLALGALATQSCESLQMVRIRTITVAIMVITAMAVTLRRMVITTNAVTSLTTTNRIALRSTCIFEQGVVPWR
jgi:hypothetical protein